MPKVSPNRTGRLCHGVIAKRVDTDPARSWAGGYSPMTQRVLTGRVHLEKIKIVARRQLLHLSSHTSSKRQPL
jgi:hypothetical protein